MSTTTTVALLLRVVYLLLMPSLIDERRLVITLPHVAGSAVAIALASPGSTAISLSPYQAVLHRMSREVPWCRSVNAPCGKSGPRWDEYSPVSSASLARPLSFLRALSPHSPLILILDHSVHPHVTTTASFVRLHMRYFPPLSSPGRSSAVSQQVKSFLLDDLVTSDF